LESGNERAISNLISYFELKPFGTASQIPVIDENGIHFYSVHVLIAIHLNAPEDHEDLVEYLSALVQNQIPEMPDQVEAITGLMHSSLTDAEVKAICANKLNLISLMDYPLRIKALIKALNLANTKRERDLELLIQEGFDGPKAEELANKKIVSLALMFDASDEAICKLWDRGMYTRDDIRAAILYKRSPDLLNHMLKSFPAEDAIPDLRSLFFIPERYRNCIFNAPNVAEKYLCSLVAAVDMDRPISATLEMIRVMMRGLSAEQLDRVMVMEKHFWNPATDFVYNEELLNLWNTDRRAIIIKNIDRFIKEPAMELALLALPIETLDNILSEIPDDCVTFKELVEITLSKKNSRTI
jgi:hypothetical protein